MVAPMLLSCCILLPQAPESAPAPAVLPQLAAPFQVSADGGPITAVTGHAAPFVVDYDGDGVRDLVVGMFGNDGEETGGSGRFYRNVGTNAAPRFTTSTPLLADGKPALMESS